MTRFLRTTFLWSVIVLLLAVVTMAETIEDTIDKTLPFAAGSRLEIANTNGDIEITTWNRDEIQIEARKRVKSSNENRARAAFEDLEVIIEETAAGVTIDTEYPRGKSGWGSVSSSVHYTIHLPGQADLEVGTVNGKVSVEGVHGDLDLHTTNGGIAVEEAGGQVSARTTNGGIEVELEEVAPGEDMTFRTTNGSITLYLPTEVQASLTARTTNGGIHTDFPITVQGSFSRNRLEGELNGGGGSIELKTTNGGIHIREH